uniref:Family with sequence similarity 170 member B n=1 Tax=Gopherus evgoodei TaxID=1825980 RepID=A0A8C4Y7Y5_9SAUR
SGGGGGLCLGWPQGPKPAPLCGHNNLQPLLHSRRGTHGFQPPRKSSARVREAEGEGEEKSLFYMKVQAVNGVSVAWETGAGFEAIRKRPRIFKAKYSGGESFAGSDLSSSHTKSELGDVDQEAESGAGGPAEEVPQQPTGVPPEWLLTIEQGVRCLACCRVFPSLEALTQHVKQGLREGFSCRVYYRVLGQMRARERSQRRRQRGGQGFQPRVRESPDSNAGPQPSIGLWPTWTQPPGTGKELTASASSLPAGTLP